MDLAGWLLAASTSSALQQQQQLLPASAKSLLLTTEQGRDRSGYLRLLRPFFIRLEKGARRPASIYVRCRLD